PHRRDRPDSIALDPIRFDRAREEEFAGGRVPDGKRSLLRLEVTRVRVMEEPGSIAVEEKRSRQTEPSSWPVSESWPSEPLEVWGRIGGRQCETRFLGV